MPEGTQLAPEEGILVSEGAAKRIAELRDMEGKDDLLFRIAVNAGGCSGFSYEFKLDTERRDDDLFFEKDGVEVVIDETSLELLKGSQLDFKQDLIGSYFQMSNPNASVTCGCGSSFGV